MSTVSASSENMSELLHTLLSKFDALEQRVTDLSGRLSGEPRISANPTPSTVAEPVEIPRPPETVQPNRSTATCKPPKEPSLTGDKQFEWMEFEREFLRYFRITQAFFMEPQVQVDLLLATAGEKVRKVFCQLGL